MLKKVTDLTDGALLVWESEIFYMKKPADCSAGYFLSGGEEEIRTLGTLLTYTRFPIVLLRPTRTPLRVVKTCSL